MGAPHSRVGSTSPSTPEFFRRLDGKVAALARAGLLAVPVLLWAAEWTDDPRVNELNPGYSLPDDQAVLLARYMVARWDAYPVAWILPGTAPTREPTQRSGGVSGARYSARWITRR